jgi:bacillithiol system protein YtxJ
MNWNTINSIKDIEELKNDSSSQVFMIFKHSTTCSISAMAKSRLEKKWDFEEKEIKPYYLDLLSYRPISAFIAETFQVHHESPQAILIQNGASFFDTSHLDITVDELHEAFDFHHENA